MARIYHITKFRRSEVGEDELPTLSIRRPFVQEFSGGRMDRTSPEIRKRTHRVPRACENCRSRKVRCDGETPCSGCRTSSINCVYRTVSRPRRRTNRTLPSSHHQSSSIPTEIAINSTLPTPAVPQVGHSHHDLVQYKRLRELRAGIGVSNGDTGSFQFYGEYVPLAYPFETRRRD